MPTFIQSIRTVTQRRFLSQKNTRRVFWWNRWFSYYISFSFSQFCCVFVLFYILVKFFIFSIFLCFCTILNIPIRTMHNKGAENPWFHSHYIKYQLQKNDVRGIYLLHHCPPKSRWIFELKHKIEGSIERCKTWLFAKGFSQRGGADYADQTYSPVV